MTETTVMKKAYAKLVARSWIDADFKQEFLANPFKVLEANGIDASLLNNTDQCAPQIGVRVPASPENMVASRASLPELSHVFHAGSFHGGTENMVASRAQLPAVPLTLATQRFSAGAENMVASRATLPEQPKLHAEAFRGKANMVASRAVLPATSNITAGALLAGRENMVASRAALS